MLYGAPNLLKRVGAGQMELPSIHLYDDAWSLAKPVA